MLKNLKIIYLFITLLLVFKGALAVEVKVESLDFDNCWVKSTGENLKFASFKHQLSKSLRIDELDRLAFAEFGELFKLKNLPQSSKDYKFLCSDSPLISGQISYNVSEKRNHEFEYFYFVLSDKFEFFEKVNNKNCSIIRPGVLYINPQKVEDLERIVEQYPGGQIERMSDTWYMLTLDRSRLFDTTIIKKQIEQEYESLSIEYDCGLNSHPGEWFSFSLEELEFLD